MAERFFILLAALALAAVGVVLWQSVRRWQASRIVAEADAAPDRPTLLYFWSDTCAPCRFQQAPIIETVQAEWGDGVHLRAVDAVARSDLAAHYGVLSVPTTIVINQQGHVVARNTGVAPAAKLRQQVSAAR